MTPPPRDPGPREPDDGAAGPHEQGPSAPRSRETWPRHIVFLDEQHARPAHPYTPEGQIRMVGDLAAAMRRRGGMRPVAFALLAIMLLPVVLSALLLIL